MDIRRTIGSTASIGCGLDDGRAGAISCDACGLNRKHDLDWPNDAFYQIEYRNSVLWAFNRDSASELLTYIESETESGKTSVQQLPDEIPAEFLTRKARGTVVKRLTAVLRKG